MHVAGISPLDSWYYTWGEGIEVVNAYQLRENDRAKRRAVALYNATVFLAHTLVEGGQIKQFNEAFPGFEPAEASQPDTMSDDAMYAVVRALNTQFGGKEDD